jgi:hypothetical protein
MLFSSRMKSISLRATLILLVTIASFAVTRGQTSESQYWYPVEPFRIEVDRKDPEVRELLERWDRIGNETQGVTNSAAGMYQMSGYNGWLLRWAPHAGFVYVYHSEGLSIIDFSYGRVEETPSEIRFIPEREMRERSPQGVKLNTPSVWVVAKFSHLKYMVPKDEMKDFGQFIAGLREYNDFNGPCCEFDPFFVSKVSTEEIASSSEILVPDEYQRFMRRPITGRILSIGKRRIVKKYGMERTLFSNLFEASSLTPITINIGRIRGLRKNMLLRLTGEQFYLWDQCIQITSVRKRTAVAVVIRSIDKRNHDSYIDYASESDKRISFPPIRPGMRVTTSPILNN